MIFPVFNCAWFGLEKQHISKRTRASGDERNERVEKNTRAHLMQIGRLARVVKGRAVIKQPSQSHSSANEKSREDCEISFKMHKFPLFQPQISTIVSKIGAKLYFNYFFSSLTNFFSWIRKITKLITSYTLTNYLFCLI